MSKKKGKTPRPAAKKMTASAPKMEAFTFGEPVRGLSRPTASRGAFHA
ncbi:TPA: hypothetical protein OCX90_000571 [Escherichia coli]|nr:hypothetical protein [Escherichia coli]